MSTLVAVYRDRDTAEEVAHELESRELHPSVRVADPADAESAVAAETHADVPQDWGRASIGDLVSSEQMRGALRFAVGLSALGAVVGLPFGLILFDASSSTLTKLGVGALVGFLFGSVVGTLLGGGLAMTSPGGHLAAERGVTVRVDDASPSDERIMAGHEPIRLDRIEGDTAEPRRATGD
jgi:hypothetical protein